MSEAFLQFDRISKSFAGVPVLREVSFSLSRGKMLGLVGENGAGKSTLMNILGGVLHADTGHMRLNGQAYAPHAPAEAARCGIGFIHQELNLFTNLSVAENIFIADFPKRRLAGFSVIDRRALRERTQTLLAALGLQVAPETLIESLSPGERQLVEIAKALSLEARLIILDEPTTSLTSRETERLFAVIERLRVQGISLIYISHVLEDVLRLCDQIVVLRDGTVVGAGARAEFSAARMVTLMVGRELEQLFPPRPDTFTDKVVLEARALTQPGIINNVSFTLRRGEVLGVAGLMGSGRTELARILFGLDQFASGEICLHGVVINALSPHQRIARGMAFLTEERHAEGLLMEATINDNIALAALPRYAGRITLDLPRARQAVSQRAEAVRLKSADLDQQPVKTLSGGNQQKAVLAKWLLTEPAVFILDEPTRGIDVGAKHEIYRLINELAARGAGLLLISSEIEELIGMCDSLLVLGHGEIKDCLVRSEFDRERIMRAALGAQVDSARQYQEMNNDR
jgi:ribose transport system ATP-binding protein